MTREEAQALKPGDRVLVTYMNGITTADVVEVERVGFYGPEIGWVQIRHVSDEVYGDRYAGGEYAAEVEYIVREGETPVPNHPMWERV